MKLVRIMIYIIVALKKIYLIIKFEIESQQ